MVMETFDRSAYYSRRKISDGFTDLPVSRQRRYQLRQAAKGLCQEGCGNLRRGESPLCASCHEKLQQRCPCGLYELRYGRRIGHVCH